MKKYNYVWSGLSAEGKKSSGEIQAMSLQQAKINLRQQGNYPISLRRKRNYFLFSPSKKIALLDIALFFRQLSTLITAGIPIIHCCEILKQGQKNHHFQKIIFSVQHEIESGKNLSESLRHHQTIFDELSCQLIKIGEHSGTLDLLLQHVATHQEKSLELIKKIKQALFYPAVVISIALIILFLMLFFIVPQFSELFQSFQRPLPWFTKLIVSFSTFLRNDFGMIALTLFLILFCLWKNISIPKLELHLPIWKTLAKQIIYARFSRNLAITFGAGIPITEGLKLIAPLCKNNFYEKKIIELQSAIISGQQLHSALLRTQSFPSVMIQMIKVGEESGTLKIMLEKLADLYESGIDRFISTLSQLLEPLIMLVLGVLIGGLVIAMYLPIFQLGTMI